MNRIILYVTTNDYNSRWFFISHIVFRYSYQILSDYVTKNAYLCDNSSNATVPSKLVDVCWRVFLSLSLSLCILSTSSNAIATYITKAASILVALLFSNWSECLVINNLPHFLHKNAVKRMNVNNMLHSAIQMLQMFEYTNIMITLPRAVGPNTYFICF